MAELEQIDRGGVRWSMAPEYQDQLLGPDGLRLPEWLRSGQARVVKQASHRTVYHVRLPGLDFYLKHYPLSDARSWLRQLVRPPKARIEYEHALAVAALRVPTITPIGLGEGGLGRGPGESYLLTHTLTDALPLGEFIDTVGEALEPARRFRVRLALADELARLLAHMHDTGVVHNDLHAGNLLVRLDPDDRVAFFLIDLHAVRIGRPLDWPTSRDNLVMLNRWFALCVDRTDRLRFWHAYRQARRLPVAEDLARDLERRTWASNLGFWRHRDRRCLVSNRYFRRVRGAAATGVILRELDAAAAASLLAAPNAPFHHPGATLLKQSPSSTVAALELPVNGAPRAVIYKRFRDTSWGDPLANLVRRPAELRSWVFGHGLRERGLPTPRPLAVLHGRRGGLWQEGYLLTEQVPDAEELQRHVAGLAALDPAEGRARLRRRIDAVARLVRELHRRRLSHRDLKAANILVSPHRCPWSVLPRPARPDDPEVWLIDLVGVTLFRKLPRARRVQNLARLHASFHRGRLLTRTDKLRFLREYLQWGLVGQAGWKRWWRDVEAATQAKVARNRHSGRPLA